MAYNNCSCDCNCLPDPNKYLYYSTKETNRMLQTQVFNASIMFKGDTEVVRLFDSIAEALPLFLPRDRMPGRIVSICTKGEEGVIVWNNYQFNSDNVLDWEDAETWELIGTSSGSGGGETGGGPIITESFQVQLGDEDQGSYKTGDEVAIDTKIEEVVKKMLQKQIPPEYVKPSLTGLEEVIGEPGELLQKVQLSYIQNDAGPITQWTMYFGESQSQVATGTSASITWTPSNQECLSDGVQKLKVVVTFGDGPVKEDNLGEPYPDGSIKAGQLTFFKNFTGKRYTWTGVSAEDIDISSSEAIRSLTPIRVNKGDSMDLDIPQGTRCVVIAIPSTFQQISSIVQESVKLPVLGSFDQTRLDVTGANDSQSMEYIIYKMYVQPLQADTYNIVF